MRQTKITPLKLEQSGFKHECVYSSQSVRVHHWRSGIILVTRVDESWNGKIVKGDYRVSLSILDNIHPVYPVNYNIGEGLSWEDITSLNAILNTFKQ